MRGPRSQSPLRRQLHRELRWLRARLVGHALLAWAGTVGLLLGLAVLTAPGWTQWGPAAGAALWILFLFVTVWVFVEELAGPWRRVKNLGAFSHELERHGAYDNLLEAATQFESGDSSDPVLFGASSELVEEVVRRAAARAAQARLSSSVPLMGLARNLGLALLSILVWSGLTGVGPDRFDLATQALVDPSSLAQEPPTTGVHAETRDLRVPVGSEARLAARDFTGLDTPAVLEINRTADFWQQESVEEEAPGGEFEPYRRLRATMEDVQDPFRYRFRRGSVVGPTFTVSVRQRPVIRTVSLELHPPAYSGRPPRTLVDPAGVVSLLEGSQVVLRGEASSLLQGAARIDEESAVRHDLAVQGSAFADTFVVSTDMTFRLHLEDEDGLSSDVMTTYRLVAEPDEAPSVRILEPARDLMLERDLLVTIEGLAVDDVRVERIDLVHRQELETEWKRIPLFRDGTAVLSNRNLRDPSFEIEDLDVALRFTWDVGELALLPGDGVVYALEVTDNNATKGGQVSRSQTWRLRLPTIAEVFDLEREERAGETDDLRDLLAEGQELEEDLERLRRELLKDPVPDWTRKEEIRDALERQQALREQLEKSVGDLQRQVEDFEKDNAGSMETLQKMDRIQELLEELKDDESLQAYLDAMRDAMDEVSPEDIERQMEESLSDQEEFNRRLDRTIELLKQLERERRMSDLVEETNEHLRRQEQIAELTDPENDGGDPTEDAEDESASEPVDDEDLARMQQKLAEETKALEERIEKELERLREEGQEGDQQPPSAEEMKKALEKALEELQDQKPSEPMERAEEELSEGDRQQAQEQQDEARKRLLSLYEVLMQGQSMMQQAQGKWAGEKLQQSAFDLLELSHREEVVFKSLRDGIRGQNLRPLTREQGRVERATEKISTDLQDLARQDFNISERLLASLRDLIVMIEEVTHDLSHERPEVSRKGSQEIMAEMNRLVIGLLTAAQSSQGGAGSSPMPDPSQQMRQMAEDQGRLNGMTQDLRKKLEHGMSGEERRQLAEMKARQKAIREQLEKLREGIEDERRILGDLEELGRAMESVEEDLERGQLDADTERQQEKILSRLLDAERSVRERDFAKRRESRGGEDLFSTQEGAEGDAEEGSDGSLRRFTAPERAPRAYRDDVRRYFRSIQRELATEKEKRQ